MVLHKNKVQPTSVRPPSFIHILTTGTAAADQGHYWEKVQPTSVKAAGSSYENNNTHKSVYLFVV